jgi:hypothetical protein
LLTRDYGEAAMMRSKAGPTLREEIRDLLTISVQPLSLYGTLLRRFDELEPGEITARLADPVTDGLRASLQDLLPALNGPYLDLSARAALVTLLAQTTLEEEQCLGIALLEHFALHLEPYLRAAELDPDQADSQRPLLSVHRLELRPVETLISARRAERQAARAAAAQTAVAPRRLAGG